ncbi:MATE family efflux transporter [uncultured Lamprocystis sp.]|uniref:MATE family efflux transporter n=1 Tax=uncultured Lamprocystis sp. TaxID=543132 RepID=UPI0025F72F03|nr:MATE family efflux transporter [uncultured Lamprocystis sp.]
MYLSLPDLPLLPRALPALRVDHAGRRRVDLGAVVALAAPLFLNSGIQAILNLTDTWFLGRISAAATAAVGGVFWFTIVILLLVGGAAMAVQTLVAQAYGAGDRTRAAASVWGGLWVVLLMSPLFVAAGLAGGWFLAPARLPPEIETLALDYWFPRVAGSVAGVALWCLTSFYNGIGRTGVTLALMTVVGVANVVLNQLLGFGFGLGVAGIAWATTAAQALGFLLGLWIFLRPRTRREFASHRHWRPRSDTMVRALALGLPMGLLPAADLIGTGLFQLMQVDLSTVAGAATQVTMMMTSIAYMPAIGIASAGTTLVGQSIGAGDRDWARRVGNTAIALTVAYMGLVSLVLAAAGPWSMPLFVNPADPHARAVVETAALLIWLGAAYQIFDGLNLGCGFALRGAGDVRLPALMTLILSWLGFLPLAHMLTFTPGAGWVDWLPQFGLGALGGWAALLVYVAALGTMMALRWRSGAWQRIVLE